MRQISCCVSSNITIDLEICANWVGKTYGVLDDRKLIVQCSTIKLLNQYWEGAADIESSVVASGVNKKL